MATRRTKQQKADLARLRAQVAADTRAQQEQAASRPVAPPRGWPGATRGEVNVPNAPEFLATSSQVCGLWPWSIGATSPIAGVPLGPHQETGAMVCGDPLTYFQELGLINNPSQFILALPGVGKSSVVRRQCIGMDGFGVINLIPGDIKPDYLVMTEKLGGVVTSVGPGRDTLNVLDDGDVPHALRRLDEAIADARRAAARAARVIEDGTVEPGEAEALSRQIAATRGFTFDGRDVTHVMLDGSDDDRATLLRAYVRNREEYAETTEKSRSALTADAHDRKVTLLSAVVALQRQDRVADWEETLLDEAVSILEETVRDRTPIVQDVLDLIVGKHDRLRRIVLDDGTDASYMAATRKIQQALLGLLQGGRLGTVFAGQSTVKIARDRHLAIDISSISDTSRELQAAVLMTTWSMSFAAVNVSHALSDAGLEPPRLYHVVMDELHRALRTGTGMVDRLDMITRVNRTEGVAVSYITHTLKDLESMPNEEDKEKARGFVERAGMVLLGGLPPAEMPKLTQVVPLSNREMAMLTSWSGRAAIDSHTGLAGARPGQGRFMIKIGDSPSIPFRLKFTAIEEAADVHDTNQRWHVQSRHSAAVVEGELETGVSA